jgi:hypothetical protein
MPVEISLVSDKVKSVKEEADPFDGSLQFVSPGDVITRFKICLDSMQEPNG